LTHRVGIVVPSLGQRPDYLEKCLRSIRAAGEAHILLVAPESLDLSNLQSLGLVDSVVADAGAGLAAAINLGIDSLPDSVEYINWLGDDDLLKPDSLNSCTDALDMKPDALMVFGACEYIDTQGDVVWNNRSGQWAVTLMRVGPDLIPQPGSLFRRSVFISVGGLRTNLGWAFDLDLFIRLSKVGTLKYLNQNLSQFRWHPESLSVEHRKRSVKEASLVRVSHLPNFLRAISFIWEFPVRLSTLLAGKRLTAKAQSKARSK
jgi:GT2 family glycosyltransferase